MTEEGVPNVPEGHGDKSALPTGDIESQQDQDPWDPSAETNGT